MVDGDTVRYIMPWTLLLAVLYVALARGLPFHTKFYAKPLNEPVDFLATID